MTSSTTLGQSLDSGEVSGGQRRSNQLIIKMQYETANEADIARTPAPLHSGL